MTYLERLRAKKTFAHAKPCTDKTDKSLPGVKNISQPYKDELPKPTKAPSVSFGSTKGKESESFFSNSANDPPPANDSPMLVEAWTPSGIKMLLEADDEAHAAWIRRMNPEPKPAEGGDANL